MSVDGSGGRSKTAMTLAPFHHPESASMLVEAALDAAERDICRSSMTEPSSPSRHSPEPVQLPPSSYCIRSPRQDGPSDTSYYSQTSSITTTDDRYHMSHSPGSQQHLHHIDSYSVPPPPHMSPSRLYSVPNHQLHQHQLLPPQVKYLHP